MSVTRDKVARMAGVSPMTVSRVFSGGAMVTPETQERVLRAARKCRYTPNAGARALRKGRFSRVAFAVVQYGDPGTGYLPNLQGYMDAAAYELARAGYSLVLEPLYLNLADEYVQPPRLFSEMGMDGILGLPLGGLATPQIDEQLRRLGCPVVWMNRMPEGEVSCVHCDERENGRRLARHLVELGHTRIGFIGFDSPHYSAEQRFEGTREVLVEAGLKTCGMTRNSRHGCINQYVEDFLDQKARPTAVICSHGNAFDTLIQHCCRRGIRVPTDLSVCHFASRWEVLWRDYKATRLEVPEKEMAVRAVSRLLRMIQGQTDVEADEQPIIGTLHAGWTTSRPGEPWPQEVARCEHEKGICVNQSQR